MTTTIYKSYGVLAHEKQPVYSAYAPASDIYDRITVEINIPTFANEAGELGVVLGGRKQWLVDVLTNWGDAPALAWYDEDGYHHIILNVIN